MNNIPKPTYAYVPGVNARHPEDWFDPIKHDVMPGMTEVDMQESHAWRAGMLYRQEGFFWECHEVLEPLWLVAPPGTLRSFLQANIQMANALLKLKMGRPNAAMRLCKIVDEHLDACAPRMVILGQSVQALRKEAIALAQILQESQ